MIVGYNSCDQLESKCGSKIYIADRHTTIDKVFKKLAVRIIVYENEVSRYGSRKN